MNASTTLQLGILGGSFDPPHRMHVRMAKQAIAQFKLDQLWICPTAWPAHRPTPQTPFVHRLNMARLAFASLPQVQVSDLEAHRPPPTFTIDTLIELTGIKPQAQWWLFIGADQAAAFHLWHRWADLLEMCRLVVSARVSGCTPSTQLLEWHNAHHKALLTLELPEDHISSTQVRAQLLHHPDVMPQGLVPAAWPYIQEHHLYRTRHA